MSGGPPAVPARGRRSRKRRLVILAGASALVLVAAAAVLLRPRPAAYVPGTDPGAGEEITHGLARSLPDGFPRVRFSDAAAAAGISFRHFQGTRSTQLPEDMGSGLAWGDYDGDGDPDLFLVNESGPLTAGAGEIARSGARAALYRNDGGGRFTDVTDAAGVGARGCGMGAAWGDFDGDGDLDLVVTRYGTNLLYRNNGDGTFTDVSLVSGVGREEGFWSGASWADYDRDGDLDLYVAGYVRYRYDETLARSASQQYRAVVPFTLNPSSYPPERNLLLRNDGGTFRDVAKQAGVDNPTGRSLSAAWCDFDLDGWPDLYVANDISDNALYRNLGNGRFEDISLSAWVADYRGAMGLGIGDWNNDGDFDIFIAHWIAQENALYDNQRQAAPSSGAPLHFLDIADQVGLGQIALDFVGWGTGFFDYDNDGRLDLFVVDGSTFQREDNPSLLVPMRNLLFWNGGPQRGFFEAGEAGGEALAVENVGRGAAFADYDGDGDLDIAVNVNGGQARLLRNDGGNGMNWARIVLRGPSAHGVPGAPGAGRKGARTTSFATGAVVRLTAGARTQMREIGSGPSYLSQSPPGEEHFGLGEAHSIDRLEIAWPDGSRQSFTDLPVNATLTIRENAGPVVDSAPEPPGSGPAAETAASPATRTAASSPSAGPSPSSPERGRSERSAILLFWDVFGRATSLRVQGDWPAAAGAYEQALALRPGHEDSLYYLGHCRSEMGRLDEAREAFARLVEVNPASVRGHLALGTVLLSPDQSRPLDLEEAQIHFEKAHALNGEETGAMVRLGEIALVREDTARARAWFESALRTNPKCVEAAFLLGYLDWLAGDRDGAAAQCRRAIQAGAVQAPVKGVLSEGDRKTAAPPLRAPVGTTLFSSLSDALRPPHGETRADDAVCDPAKVYPKVRDLAKQLVRRAPPSR